MRRHLWEQNLDEGSIFPGFGGIGKPPYLAFPGWGEYISQIYIDSVFHFMFITPFKQREIIFWGNIALLVFNAAQIKLSKKNPILKYSEQTDSKYLNSPPLHYQNETTPAPPPHW